ncbi:MAG TPA: hypothetical protein VIK53_06085 [Verrucomicrobiae bacterium]
MNYKELFDDLNENRPEGWDVIHYGNGVFLWPHHVPALKEPAEVESNAILRKYFLLFQFHVLDTGRARILARARFHVAPAPPEHDFRWKTWHDIAVKHCHALPVEEPNVVEATRSVAKWVCGSLEQINQATPINEVANLIRKFFQNPPDSLTCFIGHLGQAR